MPKEPQDRKPKKADGFSFTANGRTYKLPNLTEKAADSIPAGLTMDAVMEPEDETVQLRLALATLQAAGPSDAAMKALRSLGTTTMLEVVGAWMGELGGSSPSSESTEEPLSTTSEAASA